ncbi:thioredoxin family protein [Hydrogenophaga aquatica]
MSNSNPDGLPEILPVPASLMAASQAARRKGEPLIVMVTLKGCAYCDIVRNNYLGPMHQRGDIYAVQLNMLDRKTALQDMQGQTTTPYEQARAWKARIAPTVLFLDQQGREVAERLEGMNLADFYGAYLQERIDTARKAVRARAG